MSFVGVSAAKQGRVASSCYAATALSTVSGHTGQAYGQVQCSAQSSYYWENSLRNHAGSSLITASGYYIDSTPVSTPAVTCTGAIVHGFLYVNDNGTGSSNTDPYEKQC